MVRPVAGGWDRRSHFAHYVVSGLMIWTRYCPVCGAFLRKDDPQAPWRCGCGWESNASQGAAAPAGHERVGDEDAGPEVARKPPG